MGYARFLIAIGIFGLLTGGMVTGTRYLAAQRPANAGAGLPDPVPRAMSECAACHMLFPPQFLPRRSWTALLAKLDDHFGEIATVTDAQKTEIAAYLAANAADAPRTVGGAQFTRGIAADAVPLRITETPWWTGIHEAVNFAGLRATPVKSASNCLGCHGGSIREVSGGAE